MAQTKRKYFVVEGTHRFPYDMLRYDQCFPVSEARDSPMLDHDLHRDKRQVMLASDEPTAPTDGRWLSFGWRVLAVGTDTMKVKALCQMT